jgi:hypothetical protein
VVQHQRPPRQDLPQRRRLRGKLNSNKHTQLRVLPWQIDKSLGFPPGPSVRSERTYGGAPAPLWPVPIYGLIPYCVICGAQNVMRVIRELHRSCQTPDGGDDPSKATYLMEVYALDIQLCTVTKNAARMKVRRMRGDEDG